MVFSQYLLSLLLQYAEFFFFAGLMWVDAIIFSVMAWRYKYQDFSTPDAVVDADADEKKKRKSISSNTAQEFALENKAFQGDKDD